MSEEQCLMTILLLALTVWLSRFLPFLIFKNTKKLPAVIEYLGKVLPAAMMGLLVVYCFKDYQPSDAALLPALLCGAATGLIQWFGRNTIVSIMAGTGLYMVLIHIL